VRVQGVGNATGDYLVAAWDATSQTLPLTLGQNVFGQIEPAYRSDHWTFTAAANQQVRFNLLADSADGVTFDLMGPNGYIRFTGQLSSSASLTLPAAGAYVLTARSNAGRVGSYAFRLDLTTQTLLTLGTPYSGVFAGSGQAQIFKVDVPQGRQFLVN